MRFLIFYSAFLTGLNNNQYLYRFLLNWLRYTVCLINYCISQDLQDMDLLVCDKGPGSFTGIRIGIASVMAFTDSLKIPTVGISSLEALAYNTRDVVNNGSYVVSIIDCKNDNCYFALYEKKDNFFESSYLFISYLFDNCRQPVFIWFKA